MASNHYNEPKVPTFLYCLEENLDEQGVTYTREDFSLPQEEEEEKEEEGDNFNDQCNNNNLRKPIPNLVEQDHLSWDDEELYSLFAKEKHNPLEEGNPSLNVSRREAVEWMIKVNGYYSFTCQTAVLAVNYLDRFLPCFQPRTDKPWTTQLAAVACLSLAAKVEETQVPLLLDLQVEESKYVFEAKTIQRMEILILSNLEWRMNPVTPLSFIDYFTRRFGLKSYLCWEFLRRCELVLLSILPDSRSTDYAPSVMATATMLHVINGVEACLGSEFQSQLLGILGIEKDKVEDCWKLIRETASRDQRSQWKKRKIGSISVVPGSPNGVMDVSFSSDTSNDLWANTGTPSSSVSSSPEPLSKKGRPLSTASDFLSINPP